MPKVSLTAAFAASAQCAGGKKKIDYYDKDAVVGFCLEVRSTGGKTYYLRYFDKHGAQKQHKIGGYLDISFDKARKEAKRLRSEITLGGDPAAKKAELKAVPTYSELADDHIKHARTYMKSIKTLEGYMKRIKERWGKLRLTDIRTQDIASWAAELRDQGLAPATVAKTLVTMNRSFELGARWGVAGADKNPVKGVPRPKFSNARQTYIDAEQTARLLAAAAQSRNTLLPAIIGLLLATGMRVTELLSTRWKDVDTDRQSLFIPMSKNGSSRTLPLSKAAIAIIEDIPRPDGAVFVFPNPRDSKKRLTTITHAWQAARVLAGMPELRIHDLRHSFASAAVSAGVDIYSVGRLMGHKDYASTARYAHIANKTLMAAVESSASTLKLGTT